MKLDETDIHELLFCLDMFKGFYLEGRYDNKFSYRQRIEEAHWYLDFADLILNEAMKEKKPVVQSGGRKPDFFSSEKRKWK
jgi:hypothetical protein